MILRGVAAQVIAVFAALVLVVAACGGGSSDGEVADDSGGSATSEASAPSDSDEASTSDSDADSADPADSDSADSAESDAGDPPPAVDPDDPWAVTVLNVNDGIQIVPAFDAPGGDGAVLYDVNTIDDIELEYPLYALTAFENRLALLVEEFDESGEWARVQLPIRPNGTSAWVETSNFTALTHNFHITIDLAERTVSVFEGDDLLVEQLAVIGSAELPTPVVRTYIDEIIPGGEPRDPGFGDWILSLAAFSEVLGTFGGGGLPKIALHGTDQPELMGEAVSSGSVRVPNDVVQMIAETVPVGTVVDIVGS